MPLSEMQKTIYVPQLDELRSLKEKLEKFPVDLKNKRILISRLASSVRDYQDMVLVAEAMLKSAINGERDEFGKSKFSNDKAREAEFEIRKASDPQRLKASKLLRDEEFRLEEAKADLKFLEEQYQNTRQIFDSIVAEIKLLAL